MNNTEVGDQPINPVNKTKSAIDKALEENNCHFEIDFVKETVMGSPVLVYKIIIVQNREAK